MAEAGHHTGYGDIHAHDDPVLTGQDVWYGTAWGSLAGAAGESLSIRCVVDVNSVAAASTAWQSGTTTASTADQVAFPASPSASTMEVCAQWVGSHGGGSACFPITVTPAGTGWLATA